MNVSNGFASWRFLLAHTSSVPASRTYTFASATYSIEIKDHEITFDLLDLVLRNPDIFPFRNPIPEEENAGGGHSVLLPPIVDSIAHEGAKVFNDLHSRGLECRERGVLGDESVMRIDEASDRRLLNTRTGMSYIGTFETK